MRRRKWKVRIVALLFLLAAFGVLFKVFLVVFVSEKALPKQKIILTSSDRNRFFGVSHTTFSEGTEEFSLKSSEVSEVGGNKFNFKNLETDFTISGNDRGNITADSSHITAEGSKKCDFKGHVKLRTESGLFLETEESFVDFEKKIARGNTDIFITKDKIKLFAKKYHFDMSKNLIILIDKVKGRVNNSSISTDKLVVEFNESIGKDIKRIIATGNSTYVTDQYTLKSTRNIDYTKDRAEANENVQLHYRKQGKTYDISASHMEVTFSENKVKKVHATDKLVIRTSNSTTIKGKDGILDGDFLTVVGDVIIFDQRGVVFCDKVVLNTKTDDAKIYNSRGVINKKDQQWLAK